MADIITYPENGITYDADDASGFLSTRLSGVYSADEDFAVTANGGLTVTVSAGQAWVRPVRFRGRSIIMEQPETVTLTAADTVRSRIDRLVLRYDAAAKKTRLQVLEGTPDSASPTAPEITRTALVYDLCLAEIRRPAGSTEITAADITDTRADENMCGVMRDSVTGIPTAQLQAQAAAIEHAFGKAPIVLQNECLEISSTEARRLLFFGIADGLLHPDVLAKIEREKLYGVGGDYRGLPFEDLRRVSLSLHKEKRRAHTQGVSDTAVQLAQKYGADTQLAARAGILHDVTKALTPGEQQALIGRWQLPVTDFERANPQLLHAKTGAAAAQSIFGESDAVVSAIKYHTTGKPDMTALEKIIYLADMIEPNRTYPGVDAIREAAARDLDAGVLLALERTIAFLQEERAAVCETSIHARDWLLQARKEL